MWNLIFLENSFSLKFIDSNLKPKYLVEITRIVPNDVLFLNIEFKGDMASDIVKNRSLKKTFYLTEHRNVLSTKKLIQRSVKCKLHLWVTSVCIYQFTCCCGTGCIDRTKRALGKRISEPYPSWQCKGVIHINQQLGSRTHG